MTKKKSKTKGKKLTSKQLQTEIVKLFKRNPKKRLNPKQVSRKLKADNNRDSIQHALEQLVEAKQLIALEDYKFKLRREAQAPPSDRRTHFGVVDMTQTGSAYIICKDLENDVFVHARNLGSALDGDRVEVAVSTPRGRQTTSRRRSASARPVTATPTSTPSMPATEATGPRGCRA